MTSVRDAICNTLAEAGVEYVFGIPGGGTMGIFGSLYRHGEQIRTILTRHEHSASMMADAVGRLTGKPAVVMGQGPFIGSNGALGIMEAYMSGSPMVIITDVSDGGVPQHAGFQNTSGEFGALDLPNIFKSISKYVTVATTPKEAVLGVQQALRHAVSGHPGPAAVLLRSTATGDLGAGAEVEAPGAPFLYPTRLYQNIPKQMAQREQVERAARCLVAAQSPVLVAGGGVHMANAHAEVRELAELLAIPVATSWKGKSTIAETHPLAVGLTALDGQAVAHKVVEEADLVLAVATKLAGWDTVWEHPNLFNANRQAFIQIAIEARNVGWTFPVEEALAGDAKLVLRQLIEACRPLVAGREADNARRIEELQEKKRSLNYYEDPLMHEDSSPVLPQRMVRLIQENIDPSTIVLMDGGQNRQWMGHLFMAQREKTMFVPFGVGAVGWSMPATLGMKLVHRSRPVMAVMGDLGIGMSVHCIATAMQEDLPVVWMVLNNGGLNGLRQSQGDGVIASEFPAELDYGSVARGFGAFGVRIDDSRDLPGAVRDAFASGKPASIDVIVDKSQTTNYFQYSKPAY